MADFPVVPCNGKDLNGWIPHDPDKINGWIAKDGLLVNTMPKTDFGATGDRADLKTEAVSEDFWLHIEFLVEAQRNSGIYLAPVTAASVRRQTQFRAHRARSSA